MLVEKFWNASTGRLNRVNAAIDASNFYFNMLEIFQMYFTFPSFKNIATQRSFNEIIHFPLHCSKSTFSFQKSWRKSEKMIFAIFSIVIKVYFFPSEILQKVRKNDFWAIFSLFSKFSKVHFFSSGILLKTWKCDFQANFAALDFYSLPMVTFELKIFLTWLFKFFSEKKKSETIFKVNFEQNFKKTPNRFF